MKKFMKTLALVLAFALCIAGTAATTVALLQDEDMDVNVMTVGNVYIEQFEKERAEDGSLQDFTQNKPWIPVTMALGVADSKQEWNAVGYTGSDNIHTAAGVLDKFVFVKNTGSTEAYVRTIVAIEAPAGTEDLIHVLFNTDDGIDYSNPFYTTIGLTRYMIVTATYPEALKADAVSAPSLLQLWMDMEARNQDVNLFDGQMDVLVLSQAVQASGFATAEEGLNAAFGAVTAASVEGMFDGFLNKVEVQGTGKAALVSAIANAKDGDVVVLNEDLTITGYAANEKLVIDKAIVLDLNGKTITTECGWGGIDAKGGCVIQNGTINHVGNTAAIKAFQVEAIENVNIIVSQTAGKVKGGIVLQEGAGCYIGSIKNVTIVGATNGIETYRCGDREDLAIGYMENIVIDATDTGISLSAPIGKVVNCTIEGNNVGINAYLYGPYSVAAELVNSTVTGTTGIYAHDEVGKTNPGSLIITYDASSVISSITEEFEAEVSGRVSIKNN